MIKKVIVLADSPFHLLLASALSDSLLNDKVLILWINKKPKFLSDNFYLKFNFKFIDCSKNTFFNININKKLNSFLSKNKFDLIFTFYDTNFVFEYIKSKLKLNWSKVGIIDDGIASLFPVSMPKLYRRVPKAIFNFFFHKFPVNLQKLSLGGNKKIKLFASIYGKYLYNHAKNVRILDIKNEFYTNLKDSSLFNFHPLKIDGTIIMLSPVLVYRRKTIKELVKYLSRLLDYCNKNKKIYVKPHPRENLSMLKKAFNQIKIKSIFLPKSIPMELYFPYINKSKWIGMPSTTFFNRVLLDLKLDDEFIILQEPNDPFPLRVDVLENILNENKINHKIIRS